MQSREILKLLKESKSDKNMTMNEIAEKSNVGIRTVNRIFAGQDVRFSSIVAVLEALDLNLNIDSKAA